MHQKDVEPPAVVAHLFGRMGSGKTYLLEKIRAAHPGSIQLVTPNTMGAQFDLGQIDWDNHAAVALDELLMWDRASLVAGIAALEAHAAQNAKMLILVTQGENDLRYAEVRLQTSPARICLDGFSDYAEFSYDGKRLSLLSFGEISPEHDPCFCIE